jgi:hypothetical protein
MPPLSELRGKFSKFLRKPGPFFITTRYHNPEECNLVINEHDQSRDIGITLEIAFDTVGFEVLTAVTMKSN